MANRATRVPPLGAPASGGFGQGLSQGQGFDQGFGVPGDASPAPQVPKFQLPLPNTDDYAGEDPNADYEAPLDVTELRKQFTDYVTIKQNEIVEARTALQYYHGDQWTQEQLDTLQARGQPAITFNRVGRKIDGLVGVLEKLRGEPKAYGRVQNDEHGAELATQCVRYALDACRWAAQESELMRKGACTGIVAAELGIVEGDKDDPDIDIAPVDVTTFFYDPRSLKLDFSDCRFMGVSKLMTQDELEELFPGKWDEAMGSVDDTGETLFDNDRYFLWSQGRTKLRLVEHWYRAKGDWHFAFYAGTELLQAGLSPFCDEKGKTISRYDAFAVHVDILGEHYGFVRNLIGPQDAMNQHRSKSVHIMNTRQLIVDRSALGGDTPDIETLRREAARPDGVILYDGDPGKVRIEQAAQEFLQQTQFYQDAKSEIETFGPNPALASGSGPADVSGRSLAMQQQSGIAELGPFLSQWRGWKLRLYRKIWTQQQRNWTAERVLRVTSDQGAAQYVAINQVAADAWGRPMLVNAIGQLDVDILVDDGPDSVNVMGDVNDTLLALAHNNVPVPPALIIETSSLPQSKKEELKAMLAQPDPAQQAAQQSQLAESAAKTQKLKAGALSDQASAAHKAALARHEQVKEQATKIGAAVAALNAKARVDPGQHSAATEGQGLQPDQAADGNPADAAPLPGPGPTPPPQPSQSVGPPGPPLQPPQGAAPMPPPGIASPPSIPSTPAAAPPTFAGPTLPLPGGPPQMPPGYDAPRQQPPVSGARLAPDGHYYIFAPHARGNWRKVVRS
jgi:hypothetical protein